MSCLFIKGTKSKLKRSCTKKEEGFAVLAVIALVLGIPLVLIIVITARSYLLGVKQEVAANQALQIESSDVVDDVRVIAPGGTPLGYAEEWMEFVNNHAIRAGQNSGGLSVVYGLLELTEDCSGDLVADEYGNKCFVADNSGNIVPHSPQSECNSIYLPKFLEQVSQPCEKSKVGLAIHIPEKETITAGLVELGDPMVKKPDIGPSPGAGGPYLGGAWPPRGYGPLGPDSPPEQATPLPTAGPTPTATPEIETGSGQSYSPFG